MADVRHTIFKLESVRPGYRENRVEGKYGSIHCEGFTPNNHSLVGEVPLSLAEPWYSFLASCPFVLYRSVGSLLG